MKKMIICVLLCLGIAAGTSLAEVTVIGELTHERTLKPGDAFEGVIHLKNNGAKSEQVKIFQTDYSFTADGQTLYGEPGSVERSNASWLQVSPSRVTIPPQEVVSVYFSGEAPNVEDLRGTYWSVIMVEPVPESKPIMPKEEAGKIKLGVGTIVRYAIQIVTNIRDTGESNIEIIGEKILNVEGITCLQTDIENSGERWLRPSVWVEIYNQEGLFVGRFESRRMRIYPSCSVRHLFNVTDVPDGSYKALLIIDNADEYVFGIDYELHLERKQPVKEGAVAVRK